MTVLQVTVVIQPACQTIGALGFGGAALVQRRMLRVGITGAKQVGDVQAHIVLLQTRRRAPFGIGRQALHPIFPGVEIRAGGSIGEGHGPALGIGSLAIEIGIGRRIGHHESQADAAAGQLALTLAQDGVALHYLATAGMAGDHHLLQIGQVLAVRQASEEGVEHRETAQGLRVQGGLAAHPGIPFPAQQVVRQSMTLDIRFVEKLRGDHQGIRACSRRRRGCLAGAEIGRGITQAAMDDHQGAANFRVRLIPVGG